MSNKDAKAPRWLAKQRMFMTNYSMGPRKMAEIYNRTILINEDWRMGQPLWKLWVTSMKQQWIIDGEWSQYHSMVASQRGWGLTYKDNMWQIVSVNATILPTDEAARLHVLEAEANPEHEENALALIAVNAIVVGNLRG